MSMKHEKVKSKFSSKSVKARDFRLTKSHRVQTSIKGNQSRRDLNLQVRRNRPPTRTFSNASITSSLDSSDIQTLTNSIIDAIGHRQSDDEFERCCSRMCVMFSSEPNTTFRKAVLDEGVLRKLSLHISTPRSASSLRTAILSVSSVISTLWVEGEVSILTPLHVKSTSEALSAIVSHCQANANGVEIFYFNSSVSENRSNYKIDGEMFSWVLRSLGAIYRLGMEAVDSAETYQIASHLAKFLSQNDLSNDVVKALLCSLAGLAFGGDVLTLSMLRIKDKNGTLNDQLLALISKYFVHNDFELRVEAMNVVLNALKSSEASITESICTKPKVLDKLFRQLYCEDENCAYLAIKIFHCFVQSGESRHVALLMDYGLISSLSILSKMNSAMLDTVLSIMECLVLRGSEFHAHLQDDQLAEQLAIFANSNSNSHVFKLRAASLLKTISKEIESEKIV